MVWVCFFCVFFCFQKVFSQDIPYLPDLGAVEIDDTGGNLLASSKMSWQDIWDKYFQNKLMMSYSYGLITQRSTMTNVLRVRLPFSDQFKVTCSSEYYDSRVKMSLKRKSRFNSDGIPEKISVDINYDEFSVREAYFDWSLHESLSISCGRQTIAWGQFPLFSPIDYALPWRRSSNVVKGGGTDKTDKHVPLDVLVLNVYPWEGVEVSFYYFNQFRYDPTVTEGLEDVFSYMPNIPGESKKVDLNFVEPDDPFYALRITFNQHWGTMALTCFNGYSQDPSRMAHLKEKTVVGTTYYYGDGNYEFYRRNMLGLEASIPFLSFYTFRSEVIFYQQVIDGAPYGSWDSDQGSSYLSYINWVRTYNEKRLYFLADESIFSVGVDGVYENWNWSLYLYMIVSKVAPDYKEGYRLYEIAEHLDEGGGFSNVAPAFQVSRKFLKDKTLLLGLVLGLLDVGAGAVIYSAHNLNDNVNWGVSFEVIEYRLEGLGVDEKYEKEGIDAALRVGLEVVV